MHENVKCIHHVSTICVHVHTFCMHGLVLECVTGHMHVCNTTHSCVWQFECLDNMYTCNISDVWPHARVRNVTYSCVQYHSFMRMTTSIRCISSESRFAKSRFASSRIDSCKRALFFQDIFDTKRPAGQEFERVRWLIHMWDMTHSYARRASFIFAKATCCSCQWSEL